MTSLDGKLTKICDRRNVSQKLNPLVLLNPQEPPKIVSDAFCLTSFASRMWISVMAVAVKCKSPGAYRIVQLCMQSKYAGIGIM